MARASAGCTARPGNTSANPEGRKSGRNACLAADPIRVGDQPQDGTAFGLTVPLTLQAAADEVIE